MIITSSIEDAQSTNGVTITKQTIFKLSHTWIFPFFAGFLFIWQTGICILKALKCWLSLFDRERKILRSLLLKTLSLKMELPSLGKKIFKLSHTWFFPFFAAFLSIWQSRICILKALKCWLSLFVREGKALRSLLLKILSLQMELPSLSKKYSN